MVLFPERVSSLAIRDEEPLVRPYPENYFKKD